MMTARFDDPASIGHIIAESQSRAQWEVTNGLAYLVATCGDDISLVCDTLEQWFAKRGYTCTITENE